MRCDWQSFVNLLPVKFRTQVDQQGLEALEELRLRVGFPPELIMGKGSVWLSQKATAEDISFVVNAASRYSPWAAATIRNGYITARGGHRIGLCGDCVVQSGQMTGLRTVSSLCLRVARDFPGIAGALRAFDGNLLIIGAPGTGKTTLLRDLIRQRAAHTAKSIGVVDERGELFPAFDNSFQFDTGPRTDVLTGCDKKHGIGLLLKTMGPGTIAVDEISAQEDCTAMLYAGWSGVALLATAHAGSLEELLKRPVYKPILKKGLFQRVIVLNRSKSWTTEVL